MPHIPDQEWNQYKKRVDDLIKDMGKFKDMFENVKGAPPIIRGSQGKRFDLNENLNVIDTLKRITDAEARLTVLETP